MIYLKQKVTMDALEQLETHLCYYTIFYMAKTSWNQNIDIFMRNNYTCYLKDTTKSLQIMDNTPLNS